MSIHLELDGGKYTLKEDYRGSLIALRNGEPWRDCCGDNLIFFLAHELAEAKDKIKAAENCLICASIANPFEVCENTLKILKSTNEGS